MGCGPRPVQGTYAHTAIHVAVGYKSTSNAAG